MRFAQRNWQFYVSTLFWIPNEKCPTYRKSDLTGRLKNLQKPTRFQKLFDLSKVQLNVVGLNEGYLYQVDGIGKFYDISGLLGRERPIVPCFEAVFTVCGHHRYT